MRVESSKSFMNRLDMEAEEVKQNREKRMSEQDPEGRKSGEMEKPVKDAAGGEWKNKEEEQSDEKKGEGKKRRWKSYVKVSERYNEDDADIIIISSDGVAFKVHSLLLTRAS